MIGPLLTTKVYVPPLRSNHVPRARLLNRLEAGFDCKITLISAPAGFGKTTLISEWVDRNGLFTAWLSLDDGDNDPHRFLAYLIMALKNIQSDIGEEILDVLQSPKVPPVDELLAYLVNDLSGVSVPFVLVLDDYHLITEAEVHQVVTFLLENQPPQLHLVISGRADPPWPMARLRAQGEINELRTSDLRFTPEETIEFVHKVMGLELSVEEIRELDRRTEGWVAGIQMAALSMRGREDKQGFIRAFAGSHRYILDYLLEEVLDQQSPEVQNFLLKTSILERLTAPLCESVSGVEDAQSVLEWLERDNLFLNSLDDERRWFRYHQLFADLLRSRLDGTYPDLVPELHIQASQWFENNDLIGEAVRHAYLAADEERVIRIIENNALEMNYHGELNTLFSWLDDLPVDKVRSRPWLSVARAWAAVHAGELEDVDRFLQDVNFVLQAKEPSIDQDERRHITGHVSAILAYNAWFDGDIPKSKELSQQALERLPETDYMARAWALLVHGAMLRSLGEYEASERVLVEAVSLSKTAGDIQFTVEAMWELAVLQSRQGRLHDVLNNCQEALRLADEHVRLGGQRLLVTGYTYARMGFIYYEWNVLDSALNYAQEAVILCRRWGMADAMIQSNQILARILRAKGEYSQSKKVIQETKQIASQISEWYTSMASASEAAYYLSIGDIRLALDWVEECGFNTNDAVEFHKIDSYILYAKILVFQRLLNSQEVMDETLNLLRRLLDRAEESKAVRDNIEILIIQAISLQANGDDERALESLERAFFMSKPEKFVRIYIELGPPVERLLLMADARGMYIDYVKDLLDAIAQEKGKKNILEYPLEPVLITKAVTGFPSFPVDPLTDREMQILRLLAGTISIPDIADQKVIATSTVRSHIKSIYSKLDVHSRYEAVNKAKELDLI